MEKFIYEKPTVEAADFGDFVAGASDGSGDSPTEDW